MVDPQRSSTRDRHDRSGRGRRATSRLGAVAVTAIALLATACTSDWDPAPVFRPTTGALGVSTVRPVEDCDDLADGTRTTLEAAVAAMWSPTATDGWVSDERAVGQTAEAFSSGAAGQDDASAPATTATASDAPSDNAPRDSVAPTEADRQVIGTNLQEADVDEADIVKTDGRRIVTVTDGLLRVVQLDGSPAVDGTLDLQDRVATEMFLRGDEAVVIGSTGGMAAPMPGAPGPFDPRIAEDDVVGVEPAVPGTTLAPSRPAPEPPVFASGTTITVVSLADPAAPTATGTASVEGGYVSARMIDGVVRLVVRGEPRVMDDVMYAPDERSARAAVAAIEGRDLLPRVAVDGRIESLGGCENVLLLGTGSTGTTASTVPGRGDDRDIAVDSSMPSVPALSTVTTLTIGDSLDDLQPVTVQGNAETVYASTEALYVTASGWDEQGSRTDVHRFALPADGPATHSGSGRAPGRLLNQFSLSERDGALRVVTTADSRSSGTAGRLTVLDTEGDTLDEIGSLDGLGPGEEVKSVRFVGDLGYVVTFRTTDPLYALDLADPRAPKLLGELKIPGFSEYLHPVGDGLLLGVGRQADPETGMDTGFKVSLFDISDPAAMTEVDQIVIPDGWSAVSSDHRAFLWDAGRNQAVIPVERYAPNDSPTGGSMVVRIVDGRLQTVADLSHTAGFGAVTPIRAFVVDADLWTLSSLGLGRTSADSPGAVEQLRF